jgi:hypothetical protein
MLTMKLGQLQEGVLTILLTIVYRLMIRQHVSTYQVLTDLQAILKLKMEIVNLSTARMTG